MNKKVLSAILFSALFAGTGTFTSCIDNDEPAGIEQLRGAKAELLRAKAAVEAAKVALVNAEAAAAQAQATLLQAQAAAAQAESAAEVARLQAEAEIAIAQAEAIRKQTEITYQQAIINLKSLQATLVGTQAAAVAELVTDYDLKLKAYNEAVYNQTEAQRSLNNHLAVTEEKESKKELFTRELSRKVTMAEAALEGEKVALADAEAALAEVEALEPHALAVKLEELAEKQHALNLAVVDLRLEAAETIYGFYESGRVKELGDLWNAYVDLKKEEQVIPAVEFDFGDGAGYPLYLRNGNVVPRGVVTLEETTYSAYDPTAFIGRHAELEMILEEFESWTRDENDNAWTAEAIVKMEGDLKLLEEEITEAKKAWAEAVAAFNTGKYNESDPSKISGYTELVAALTAYNTAATEYNTAKAAVAPLDTEAADKKTRDEALAANLKAFNAAKAAADKAKTDALVAETLQAAYEKNKKELEKATKDAEAALKTADDNLKAEEAKGTAADVDKLTALASLKRIAQDAYDKALEKETNYTILVETDNVIAAHEKAIADATEAYTDADAAANKAYNDKWNTTNGTGWAAIKAAKEVVAAKNKVVTEAKDALIEAANTYNNNVPEVSPKPIKIIDINAAFIGKINLATREETKLTIELEKLLKLNKDALVDAVVRRSEYLFGTNWYARNAYGDYDARLKELTKEQIAADIAELEITSFADYDYACMGYGLLGNSMRLAERIRIAKSWLENGELIEAKIAQAQEAHDSLVANFEALELALEEKMEAFEEAKDKLNEDALAAIEPIKVKIAEMKPLVDLYNAYANAKFAYQNLGEAAYSQEEIDALIISFKGYVEEAETKVYDAETTLMWAKEDLEKWNQGDIRRTEILQAQLERATAAVAIAHEALVNAQTRLQQAMAALEWTAAE